MHLPTTTQILLLASASLLALTSARLLPPTTLIAITTSTGITSPTPFPIEKKRQVNDHPHPNANDDALGHPLPSAEVSEAQLNAEETEFIESTSARAKRQVGHGTDYPGAEIVEKRQTGNEAEDEIPGVVFSDGIIVSEDQNPAHDMYFSENIGP